jgi:O-antigen/teichoic acid export membrane protein
MGIDGILLARLSGTAITAFLFSLVVIVPRLTPRFEVSLIWEAIKFGFPAIAGNIGFLIFQLNDRYMLNWLTTSAETGKYAFGYKIANFINLIFVSTIGLSFMPSIFSKEKEEDNLRYYRKMLTYYCFLISLIILGFLYFYKDLLSLVAKNRDYFAGLAVVPVLAFSFMIMGMNYFVGVGLYLKNRMIFFLIPSFSAVIANIVLNLILIPKLGMMGAAYSNLVAQVLYTSLLAVTASRFLKVSFEWMKVLMIFVLAIGLFIGGRFAESAGMVISYGIKILMLGLFPIILYKLDFFEKIELQRLKEGIAKIFDRYNQW